MKRLQSVVVAVALVMALPVFAQEPQAPQPDEPKAEQQAPEPPKLTAEEQATFNAVKVQQVLAKAAVLKTRQYRDHMKAQQQLQEAQTTARAKQQAMMTVLQASPEWKAMLALRQVLETQLKTRGERNVVDWRTGALKPPAARR